MMKDNFNCDDYSDHGSFCDCCSATIEEAALHTLDIDCSITLCEQCIRRFYALLCSNTPGRIIKIPERHNLK